MIILKVLSFMKNNMNMKLKNKLDTNNFFYQCKKMIIRNLYVFVLYLYIVFSSFFILQYEMI